MDNFEKHIREHATEFDEHKADTAKLWENIAKELKTEEPKVIPLWKSPMIRIAASVVLLLGLAGYIGMSVLGMGNTETQYASKELLDIDMHYKGLVSYQVELVKNNPKLSDGDKTEFLSFMDELDEEYEQLRVEMRNNLDNERVLEAIISNYKQRIALIEQLLQQINESNIIKEDYGYTL
ncbi:MAG: hypothetical protein GY931_04970 [Maribacter sp.]|nr:hypothetical protein [Maribacter sp.]